MTVVESTYESHPSTRIKTINDLLVLFEVSAFQRYFIRDFSVFNHRSHQYTSTGEVLRCHSRINSPHTIPQMQAGQVTNTLSQRVR